MAVQEKVHEASDEKERQDHKRMLILAEMDNWSHLLLRLQMYSAGADVRNLLSRTQPVHTRGSNAVMKKLNLGHRANRHANWS